MLSGVDPVSGNLVPFLGANSCHQYHHVVAHRRLVATHRVDVIVAAALRVGVDTGCDPEDSYSVEWFRVGVQEHPDFRP